MEIYNYGYGELGNQLIALFKDFPPDFEKAEELIRLGVDLNAETTDEFNRNNENMLSEILFDFGSPYDYDNNQESSADKRIEYTEEQIGEAMLETIRFFLSHGFSLQNNGGLYGTQCLRSLAYSTRDTYMLDGAKLLLDAGAKNGIAYSDDNESALSFIAGEASAVGIVYQDHSLANIFEAFYQVFLAADEGRPYSGISHFMVCYDKRIIRVMADKPTTGDVFYNLSLSAFQKDNCFNQTLYFEYDTGKLILTQYAELWTEASDSIDETMDVSETFRDIIGASVKQITFGHNEIRHGTTAYGQPIINLEMANGVTVRFSINFGEVEDENRCAYFSINKEKV